MNKAYINKIFQAIAGGVVAVFLAVPAFGQSKLPLGPCADPTKILPAAKTACDADNAIRTECNTKSNPAQCYNAKKAAASTSTTTATTTPASTPVTTQPATRATTQPATPATTQPATPATTQAAQPAATPTATTASTSSGLVSAVPAGAKSCATDSKICNVTGSWTGVYGANGKFAKISGSGSFTCLPKNLGIEDPAPRVAKTCYLTSGTMASSATATRAAPAKVSQLPLTCAGGLIQDKPKKFASTSDFASTYKWSENLAETSADAAKSACQAYCAKTGEPEPCGWYTLVQWRVDTSADGKSRGQYGCYMVNARNYKDAFTPKMETGKNYGSPSNGLFYTDAWTYPCAR